MAFAANRIRELGGGIVSVKNGKVVAEMPLPIGGLMSCETAEKAAEENEKVRESVYSLGVPKGFEPFYDYVVFELAGNTAFKAYH